MQQAENLIEEAMNYGAELGLRPLGIGVGVPGLVDTRQGKLVFAPNLKWSDMPIGLIWMRRFNLPVFVENEANCAALGEYFYGAAHNVNVFIHLTTGIGLGGGIMINGHLYKGVNGFAGEIGHMTIYQNGEVCGCGRHGCWETYVSPRAMLQRVRQMLVGVKDSQVLVLAGGDPEKITEEIVIEAARQNDPVALGVLHEMGEHLGVGIANLVNIFNPEMIVLGGALSHASPWLFPVIRSVLKDNVLPPLRDTIRIEASAQGVNACVVGAASLVLDDLLREPLYSAM
ncbi:MAG TPA: ROK family protein, partial [Anaerolineaceae bacterium]|nr:ROK family protein [Anaerolineaceae bacterium]